MAGYAPMEKKLCKRCLLEYSDDKLAQTISDYLEGMPEEAKTDETVYKYRISHCRSCESNISGMCRICGCFIEVRAIKKISYCPSPKRYW